MCSVLAMTEETKQLGFIDALATLNSFLRTVIALVLLAVILAVGWLAYDKLDANRQLTKAQDELKLVSLQLTEKEGEVKTLTHDLTLSRQQVEKLQTAVKLMKTDRRIAELRVMDQRSAEDGTIVTDMQFVEMDESGTPIDEPKQFTMKGDKAYIDYWIVKFDDKYIEEAEIGRSTSICLFRRIYGEYLTPNQGFTLDSIGTRPKAYAEGNEVSDFEAKIWSDFWEFANNKEKAEAKGIRAAHGQAVYTQMRAGQTYQLELRASDGLTIRVKDDS